MATIVVDSREKDPYTFSGSIPVIRHALPAGDYSLGGYEQVVAVERKSLNDLVQTLIRAKKRFHAELRRLQQYLLAYVVVEANWDDILQHRYRSAAHPNAVREMVVSICVDFGIPVCFYSHRQGARQFVEDFLLHAYQKVKL